MRRMRPMACITTLATLLLAGCGGGSSGPAAAEPEAAAEASEPVADPTVPTSFGGATRTWEITNQSVGSCTYVDVLVCPDGGDIESCDTDHLEPYPCPPEGIWGSSPWHIYELDGTCWLHGETTTDCEGPQCTVAVTRSVDCPG